MRLSWGPTTPDIVFFGNYLTRLADMAAVPVAINLDHGMEFAHAVTAIKAGFTSIMIDRSSLPYEENVSQVMELTKIAHAAGVSVEAELGHVGQGQNYNPGGIQNLTIPTQARDFIQRTGIDCLAVAIGTAHGAYRGVPRIDFDRLTEIKKLTQFPLVMHGSSGTGDVNLQKACRLGINKVNIAYDLFRSAYDNLIGTDMSGNRIYKIWEVCKTGYRSRLKELIECFGSTNKAATS